MFVPIGRIHQTKIEKIATTRPKTIFIGKDKIPMNDAIEAIEKKSFLLTESFSNLLGSLKAHLHGTSGIIIQNLEVYKASTVDLCNETEDLIRQQDEFISKCKELDVEMEKTQALYQEIKELKKGVDQMLKLLEMNKK